MGVCYRKLRELLIQYKVKNYEMKEATGLSNNVLAKIRKDEYIQLDKLECIMGYLDGVTGKKLEFEDVMERVGE